MIYSLKYTENVPNGHAGATRLWMIYINPAYKDDRGLLEHEIDHVNLFWAMFLVSLFILIGVGIYLQSLYILILVPFCFGLKDILIKFKPFLRWAEVKAYKKQLQYPPASMGDVEVYRKIYAGFLANNSKYNLDITIDTAYNLLK